MSIRVGVVGCGFIAQYTYLPLITALGAERADVVAVFDTVDERVSVAQEQFPDAAGYTTYDAFLGHEGGFDLVLNLTPAPLHREISAKALDAGFSVYSEKPIAASLEDARELTRIADSKHVELFVAPSTTTTARMVWLKEKIANGDFGHAHTIKANIGGLGAAYWREYTGDPKVFYRKGVGPMVDLGVYMLHTMTGLFGPATTVSAVGGIVFPERTIQTERFKGEKLTVEAPDNLSVNLTFNDNRFANLFTSYAVPATKSPMFELYGTLGSASVSSRQWYDGNGGTDIYIRDELGDQPGAWEDDAAAPNPLPIGGILESGMLHAAEVLQGNATNVLTAAHATHVLEIMLAAERSAETGETVVLETTF